MAQTSSILLNAGDRERLTALVADRNRPHKHVQRARIILCAGERLPVLQIAKRVGVSRPAVWRWQQRFAEEGVEGLLRDKTRPPGKAPVPPETVAQVLAITCSEPPGEVTHWTGRAVAERVGLALRTIQRIWRAHRVEPHRVRTFKRSNDPAFAEKVEDIVGLYMSPHDHAVCGPERARRHGARSLHAAPPSSGIHPLSQRRRGSSPGRQDRTRDHGQLCRPQASEGTRLAVAPSALGVPFHADLGLMALGAHATPAE